MTLNLEALETSFDLVAPRGEELMDVFYARLFAAAPAVMEDVPVTIKAPVSVIALPPLLATRLPVTVPWPRFSAPVEFAVRSPVASVPKVSAFMSVTCMAAPVSDSAPTKLFAALVSVIASAVVVRLEVPLTTRAAV